MKYAIILLALLVSSCKSVGYYSMYDEPVSRQDIINHGIHSPCDGVEFVSFNIKIAGHPTYYVSGNNIPYHYRQWLDTSGVCDGGCTIYLSDIVITKNGETKHQKKKLYINVVE